MVVLDVDRSWPNNVGLGPGFDLRNGPPARELFKEVSIDYDDSGPERGSFEVDGIVETLARLREVELQQFRNGNLTVPWWAQ